MGLVLVALLAVLVLVARWWVRRSLPPMARVSKHASGAPDLLAGPFMPCKAGFSDSS